MLGKHLRKLNVFQPIKFGDCLKRDVVVLLTKAFGSVVAFDATCNVYFADFLKGMLDDTMTTSKTQMSFSFMLSNGEVVTSGEIGALLCDFARRRTAGDRECLLCRVECCSGLGEKC